MYRITLRKKYTKKEQGFAEKAARALNKQIWGITDAYAAPSQTKVVLFRDISSKHRLSTVAGANSQTFSVAAIDDLPVIRDFVMHTTMWYITHCHNYKFDVDIELV